MLALSSGVHSWNRSSPSFQPTTTTVATFLGLEVSTTWIASNNPGCGIFFLGIDFSSPYTKTIVLFTSGYRDVQLTSRLVDSYPHLLEVLTFVRLHEEAVANIHLLESLTVL